MDVNFTYDAGGEAVPRHPLYIEGPPISISGGLFLVTSLIRLNYTFILYCDVHAVGLRSRRYLVTTRHGTMDVSLRSVPRKCLLYGLSPGYITPHHWQFSKEHTGPRIE
jgi:hypothetical protein